MPLSAQEILRIKRAQQNRKRKVRKLPKPPRMAFPKGLQRDYSRQLVALVKVIYEVYEELLIPHLESIVAEANLLRPDRADDWNDSLDRQFEQVKNRLTEEFVIAESVAMGIGQEISDWNDREWRKVLKAVFKAEIFQREAWLAQEMNTFVKENVSLITSIKDDSVREIEGIIRRGVQSGKRHEQLAVQIRERYATDRRRAQVIARDQVSKFNGNLTMLRQQNMGVRKYIWHTSGDRRVRPTHEANEGQVFSWDYPPATGHPGEEVQCRCTAEAVFEDTMAQQIMLEE